MESCPLTPRLNQISNLLLAKLPRAKLLIAFSMDRGLKAVDCPWRAPFIKNKDLTPIPHLVRAGAVAHPSAWPFSGYNEIQNPRERYSLIDCGSLMDLLNIKSAGELKEAYRGWVEESLEKQACERQPRWTESIAVGSEAFVKDRKEKLGVRAHGRKVIGENGNCELREVEVLYKPNFGLENSGLSSENAYYWNISI